jgi:hypothetical protein
MPLVEPQGDTGQMGKDAVLPDGRFALGDACSILVAGRLAVSLAVALASMSGREATR